MMDLKLKYLIYAYLIKNKHLHYDNYKVKCAIGKKGSVLKKEGDLITPKRQL